MKITYLFVALMAIILSGCEQEANVEPNEIEVSFDKELDDFYQRAVSGAGYTLGGAGRDGMKTITEIANIRLSYANYKSSQKLQTSIDEFNRSSTALAKKMLYLTIVIAVLTLVMVIQNVGKVKNLIGRFFVWTRKIVGSLAHSYMQRFPKTQKVTKPPVKQNEVSNESKGSSRKPPTQGN